MSPTSFSLSWAVFARAGLSFEASNTLSLKEVIKHCVCEKMQTGKEKIVCAFWGRVSLLKRPICSCSFSLAPQDAPEVMESVSQSVSHSAFSTDLTEEKDQEGEKDFESEEGEEDDEDCKDDEDEYIHLVMGYLVTKV